MDTTINRIISLAIIVGMIILTATLLTQKTFGSAPSGLPASVATTTTLSLSVGTAGTIAATSTCAARIITTEQAGVMLTFSDFNGQTPSGTIGHWQAASTTVAYDSGQYGCGLVKAYGMGTGNITISETR